MALEKTQFSVMLLGLEKILKHTARRHKSFAQRLKEKNLIAQIKVKDNSQGRFFVLKDGKISSKNGIHTSPDLCITFRTPELAVKVLRPPRDYMALINAGKNFQMELVGPDTLTSWFMETLSIMLTAGTKFGTVMGNGIKRYTSNTNGGPVFVYVKNGKVIRITPIDFDDSDALHGQLKRGARGFLRREKLLSVPMPLPGSLWSIHLTGCFTL